MNDIQKAMSFLREERRLRLESPVSDAELVIDVEPTGPVIERSRDAGDPGRADADREHVADERTVSPVSVNGSSRRFDDELFADDLLDGIGTGQSTPSVTAQTSGSPATESMPVATAPMNDHSPDTRRVASDNAVVAVGRVSVDEPEPGVVTPSPSLPDASPSVMNGHRPLVDMPELGIVAGPLPDDEIGASDRSGRVDAAGPSSDERGSAESSEDTAGRDAFVAHELGADAWSSEQGSPASSASPERTSSPAPLDREGVPPEQAPDEADPSEPRIARTDTDRGAGIVSLPLKRLAARGFLTPGIAKGRLSEEFRRVKRPILRNIADAEATDGHRNVVMITSSVAGEGKTYTAINLAMSLAAERERTVLLVDADVIKGSAGVVLGVGKDRPGLTDVLDDERLDIADVMLATDVPDLRFVPAGRSEENTTELLSSPRMSDLIDELARRYADRIIVLDCPPMLQTNEANVIADHAGQVVFVVAGEETDQRLVIEAMNRFDADKSVGVLLNKASNNSAAYGYDYGYG